MGTDYRFAIMGERKHGWGRIVASRFTELPGVRTRSDLRDQTLLSDLIVPESTYLPRKDYSFSGNKPTI